MLTALSESSGETKNVIVKPCKNSKSSDDFRGKEIKPLPLGLVNAQAAAERDNGPELIWEDTRRVSEQRWGQAGPAAWEETDQLSVHFCKEPRAVWLGAFYGELGRSLCSSPGLSTGNSLRLHQEPLLVPDNPLLSTLAVLLSKPYLNIENWLAWVWESTQELR